MSTAAKRQPLWVCWQEPESDRGKFSLIPGSWVARAVTGDGSSPGSLILCRWPRSDELFSAKVISDPSPSDLARVELLKVPVLSEDEVSDVAPRPVRPQMASGKSAAGASNGETLAMLTQMKKFFLNELGKMSSDMQNNFDILGHRIGALEVNVKCIRDRVERVEQLLNANVHDVADDGQLLFADHDDDSTCKLTQYGASAVTAAAGSQRAESAKSIKSATPAASAAAAAAAAAAAVVAAAAQLRCKMEDEDEATTIIEDTKAEIIPRMSEQRVRKDRNPRPRAVVVANPHNRSLVHLGGNSKYQMQLSTYMDAIRHAKRPTATYMVTALLRRYLPATVLSHLCVNERQMANTSDGHLLDMDLLEALKKQGRMQFPDTPINDRELLCRIEDVARDVRRKIKAKKTLCKRGVGGNSTPITMVPAHRHSFGNSRFSLSSIDKSQDKEMDDEDLIVAMNGGSALRLRDSDDGGYMDDKYEDDDAQDDDDLLSTEAQALPMFS